jgi:hypothetical protein
MSPAARKGQKAAADTADEFYCQDGEISCRVQHLAFQLSAAVSIIRDTKSIVEPARNR